ncbi:MAG: hypothetical protein ACM3UZ_09190 [Acidobacteriota bacterium]
MKNCLLAFFVGLLLTPLLLFAVFGLWNFIPLIFILVYGYIGYFIANRIENKSILCSIFFAIGAVTIPLVIAYLEGFSHPRVRTALTIFIAPVLCTPVLTACLTKIFLRKEPKE